MKNKKARTDRHNNTKIYQQQINTEQWVTTSNKSKRRLHSHTVQHMCFDVSQQLAQQL